MGNPIDLRFIPIFIAREIYDFPRFPGYRVVVGEEAACSYYTKVAIVDDLNITDIQLDELRAELRKAISTASDSDSRAK
jgi:hypothetical protein